MIDINCAFNNYDDDYLKFERVVDKLHPRPDICAFLLLDKILPNDGFDMVCGAEHDEIYLDVDCERLAEVATEEDVLTLVRCGVHYDEETDSLAMFA
jgi:hypothetical protein